MNWRCKLWGHRWRLIWEGTSDTYGTVTCTRCGETGWRT